MISRLCRGRELKSYGPSTAKDDSFDCSDGTTGCIVLFIWEYYKIYQGDYLCSVQFRNLAEAV